MHHPRTHTAAVTAHLTAAAARLRSITRSSPKPGPAPAGHTTAVGSTARVPTARSARYAKQLCSHAAWKTPHAQWTEPTGLIEFPDNMGTCRITAEPNCLVLAVEATDPAELARMQQIIGGNIERFAAREGLTVQWTPT
jgi:hypothetical protein